MLDTIAYTEGTAGHGKDGYNVMVGYHYFDSCNQHPNICWSFGSSGNCSTAAGRYQFIIGTWNSLGYSNMWPENQDRGGIKLINRRGVTLPDRPLSATEFANAMDELSWEWASLPPGQYGQPSYTMAQTRAKYCQFAHCDSPPAVIGEGSFIRDKASGEVYVVAGGAPLYVATSSLVTSPAIDVDSTYLAKMNAVPRDGTFISGSAEAYEVVGGAPLYVSSWANVGGVPSGGAIRVDDAAIQGAGAASGRYSHLRKVPSDGTFFQDGVTHEAYVIAGGAPIYVTAWANVGGAPSATIAMVDGVAIGAAGAASGRYSHLNAVPADGTFVQDGVTGEAFVIAGGAPTYITAWANVGGKPADAPVIKIDGGSIAAGGAATGHFSHLNRVPADGTFVQDGVTGEAFVTVGGAPIYISAWANVGGNPAHAPVVKVDGAAINAAGAASGRYSHLNRIPADGAFLQDGVSHEAYVVAGGAPIYITSWNNVTAPASPLPNVDGAAIASAGAASGRYSHLNRVPSDGTFVHSKDGTVYRIEGGAPIYVSTWNAFTAEERALPRVAVDEASLANAGAELAHFKHLNLCPADGTHLLGSTGLKYVVQAGTAVPYAGTDAFAATSRVDQYAIDNAGGTGPLVHLK